MGLYVYGLMRAEDGARAAQAASIETVEHDGLCALVTTIAEGDLRLRRESALAHSETLQAVFAHGPVLPVRFGTVLPDAESLERELLAPRAEALRARLEALEGMSEMQVKASYLEAPLLRSILEADPRLKAAATRVRGLPPAAAHFERIHLGEAIHHAVEARRESDSQQLIEALRPRSVAVSVHKPHQDHAALNASFLVAEGRVDAFDAEVERLSNEFATKMQFKLIGPMPAHSFAESWDGPVGAGSPRWG